MHLTSKPMLSILKLHSISLGFFFFLFVPKCYSLMCGQCIEASFTIDKALHRIVIGSFLGAVHGTAATY